jgi:hypothetical protein
MDTVLANVTSFTSPLAHADLKVQAAHVSGVLGRLLQHLNFWTVLLTVLPLLVAYDQCER